MPGRSKQEKAQPSGHRGWVIFHRGENCHENVLMERSQSKIGWEVIMPHMKGKQDQGRGGKSAPLSETKPVATVAG